MIIFLIIYFVCIFIEINILRRNNISIFYKNNLIFVLLNCVIFPLVIFTLFFVYNSIKNIPYIHDNPIGLIGYLFTFMFASLAYIIHYIKSTIYAFISNKNKLSFFNTKTIYSKEN